MVKQIWRGIKVYVVEKFHILEKYFNYFWFVIIA